MEAHYRGLEAMYASAPCNQDLGLRLKITEGFAEVWMPARPSMHHAAGAVHGSYYFKLLDDACFFAANSLVADTMVLTASFTLQLLRPVAAGEIVARGVVIKPGKRLLFVEAQLFDASGQMLATGTGTFARSSMRLTDVPGYVTE